MKIGDNARHRLPPFLILVLLIASWEMICRIFALPDLFSRSFKYRQGTCRKLYLLMEHTSATLYAVTIGLLLAVAVAMLLALAMNRWTPVRNAVYPPAGDLTGNPHICPGSADPHLAWRGLETQNRRGHPGLFLPSGGKYCRRAGTGEPGSP